MLFSAFVLGVADHCGSTAQGTGRAAQLPDGRPLGSRPRSGGASSGAPTELYEKARTLSNRFLRDAGIADGMRVLDLAWGVGDMSLMVGRLVGGHGSVIGIDIALEALAVATARAKEEGLEHVRFIQADLGSFEADKRHDPVTARHILIHTPDPVGLIRRAAGFVHPGGILAFQARGGRA